MLTLKEEILLEIATLAQQSIKASDSRYGNEMTALSGDELWERFIDAEKVPSLPEKKLERILRTLTQDELCQLKAIIWLGRDTVFDGDHTDNTTTYEELYREAKQYNDEYAVEYITDKWPVIARYIKRGMLLVRDVERTE